MKYGKIIQIRPRIIGNRICACLRVKLTEGSCIDAYMQAREFNALVPKDLLIGEDSAVYPDLLEKIHRILQKLTIGREVSVISIDSVYCVRFPDWKEMDLSTFL
ncbi:MAG: hypothetical protein ACLFR1_07160 [Spirochaetia bacterium]